MELEKLKEWLEDVGLSFEFTIEELFKKDLKGIPAEEIADMGWLIKSGGADVYIPKESEVGKLYEKEARIFKIEGKEYVEVPLSSFNRGSALYSVGGIYASIESIRTVSYDKTSELLKQAEGVCLNFYGEHDELPKIAKYFIEHLVSIITPDKKHIAEKTYIGVGWESFHVCYGIKPKFWEEIEFSYEEYKDPVTGITFVIEKGAEESPMKEVINMIKEYVETGVF